jgi:hypothetical protein
MRTESAYIPALRFSALTPLYDFVLRWLMQEERFKQVMVQQADLEKGSLQGEIFSWPTESSCRTPVPTLPILYANTLLPNFKASRKTFLSICWLIIFQAVTCLS